MHWSRLYPFWYNLSIELLPLAIFFHVQMEDAGNGLNIIILDACRNNPFARSFRSAVQGLAKMDAPTGSILAYSTSPGSVAVDGAGRNGLYTASLLKRIATPGITVERMFKLIRQEVTRESSMQQVPWESSSMIGDFYFAPQRGIIVDERAGNEPARESAKTEERGKLKIAAVHSDTAKARHPAGEIYRLAVLPIWYDVRNPSFSREAKQDTINYLFEESERDPRLELAYAYEKPTISSNTVQVLTENYKEEELQAWKKESYFSKLTPDWEKVRKIGSGIDADFAVLIKIIHFTDSTIDFYLYDYKRGKIYSTTGYGTYFYATGSGLRDAMQITMDKFYKEQQD